METFRGVGPGKQVTHVSNLLQLLLRFILSDVSPDSSSTYVSNYFSLLVFVPS